MAITNFVPEIWSAQILQNLTASLVYAQAGIINRDYEGEIAQAGDTVHLTRFGAPTVRSYTKGTDISIDTLTDAEAGPLVVSQQDYFSFSVDDVDRRQALPGFVASVTADAGYNLAASVDTYVSGVMATAATSIGSVTVTAAAPGAAYALLLNLRTQLGRQNVPNQGRFVIVPPELYAVLLRDDRFIRANEAGTDAGLRNGLVGRAAGFDVIESNTVPDTAAANSSSAAHQKTTGVFTVIAGHPMGTTFAEQINEVEAYRVEKQFADGVKGLHLYGAKCPVYKDNSGNTKNVLAKAAVTVVVEPGD